jgi:hypothetical protein
MPSRSKSQAKTMLAAVKNPSFAKKARIPQDVAKDFAKQDQKRGTKHLPQRKQKR